MEEDIWIQKTRRSYDDKISKHHHASLRYVRVHTLVLKFSKAYEKKRPNLLDVSYISHREIACLEISMLDADN